MQQKWIIFLHDYRMRMDFPARILLPRMPFSLLNCATLTPYFCAMPPKSLSVSDAVIDSFGFGDVYGVPPCQVCVGFVIIDAVFVVDEITHHVAWEAEGIGLLVSGNDIFLEFRVQGTQFVHADVAYGCHLLQVAGA